MLLLASAACSDASGSPAQDQEPVDSVEADLTSDSVEGTIAGYLAPGTPRQVVFAAYDEGLDTIEASLNAWKPSRPLPSRRIAGTNCVKTVNPGGLAGNVPGPPMSLVARYDGATVSMVTGPKGFQITEVDRPTDDVMRLRFGLAGTALPVRLPVARAITVTGPSILDDGSTVLHAATGIHFTWTSPARTRLGMVSMTIESSDFKNGLPGGNLYEGITCFARAASGYGAIPSAALRQFTPRGSTTVSVSHQHRIDRVAANGWRVRAESEAWSYGGEAILQ